MKLDHKPVIVNHDQKTVYVMNTQKEAQTFCKNMLRTSRSLMIFWHKRLDEADFDKGYKIETKYLKKKE